MNLRDLEYLVAVADHRHFGRAADACFVSQPTLSTQLKKLEIELGVELVERSSRQVLVTAAGEQIVARARTVLAEAEAIRRIAGNARDPRAGRLALGAFPTIAPYLLPHVLGDLRRTLPDVELLLVEEKTSTLLDQLRRGSLDAAVVALPVPEEGWRVEPLFREDFLLAVPVGHPLATDPGPLTVADLAGENLLLLTTGHCLRDQTLAVCQEAGAHERSGFRATSLETLRHMVAAGLGLTLLPRLSVPEPSERSGVVVRAFADPAPHRDLVLLSRPGNVRDELLSEVAAVLRRLPSGLVGEVPHGAGVEGGA